MALSKQNFDKTGSGSKGVGCFAIYRDTAVAQATMTAANYFNTLADEFDGVRAMLVVASDKTFMCKVSVAAGVVTVAALDAFA